MKKGHRFAEDITGKKFGKLTAIRIDKVKRYKTTVETYWLCECECGNFTSIEASKLKRGHTKSCGCLRRCSKKGYVTKSDYRKLYRVWIGMKSRCYNPKMDNYKYYGEKGIEVCDEWKDDFQAFYDWSMENGYDSGLTIDRINGNKNYCPENCRWVTRKEQARNTSQTKSLEYNGQTKTFSEWSEITGINKETIKQRIRTGWSSEKALETPVRKRSKKEP